MPHVIATAGLLASVTGLVGGLPHARHVWRHRGDPAALQGISLTTFGVALVGNVLWAVYGIGIASFWVAVPTAVNGPIAVLTLVVVGRGRCRRAGAGPGAATTGLPAHRVTALARRSIGHVPTARNPHDEALVARAAS